MALPAKKLAAVNALLTGGTIKAAAEAAKTTEQTLHRWLGEEEFAAELQAAANRALYQAVGLLKVRAVGAVQRLSLEMDSDDPSTARIQAADKLLNHVARLSECVEMRAKVEQLERDLRRIGDGDGRPTDAAGEGVDAVPETRSKGGKTKPVGVAAGGAVPAAGHEADPA